MIACWYSFTISPSPGKPLSIPQGESQMLFRAVLVEKRWIGLLKKRRMLLIKTLQNSRHKRLTQKFRFILYPEPAAVNVQRPHLPFIQHHSDPVRALQLLSFVLCVPYHSVGLVSGKIMKSGQAREEPAPTGFEHKKRNSLYMTGCQSVIILTTLGLTTPSIPFSIGN